MRYSLLAAICVTVPAAGAAQEPAAEAVQRFGRAVAGAREALARDGGSTWGVRLDTLEWLGVLDGRIHATAQPAAPGFSRQGALWAGPLPQGLAPANTSLDWANRRWAMVVLPLPEDSLEAERLLIHEALHAAESAVPVRDRPNESGIVGGDLLDQPDGRTWLQLEWRALADALEAEGAAQDVALSRALVFRARRYSAGTPEERLRERLLDLHEGLAEYTAWRVTGSSPAELARQLRGEAPRRRSFVRSFAYFTGPAYGLLLDRRSPGWTRLLAETPDLQRLALATLREPPGEVRPWLVGTGNPGAIERAANREGAALGLAPLRASERARWLRQVLALRNARARFVNGPTLRIRPGALNVVFDPNGQLPLGESSTVMRGFQWRGANGAALNGPGGVLVTGDWQEIRVPLGAARVSAGPLAAPREWSGEGWTLSLPAGWRMTRYGTSWVAEPPAGGR